MHSSFVVDKLMGSVACCSLKGQLQLPNWERLACGKENTVSYLLVLSVIRMLFIIVMVSP